MENNTLLMKAEEVSKLLGISRSHAYDIIKQLNEELSAKGYLVFNGRISRKYLEEQVYGMSGEKSKGD